jgi:putative ABC transport system permease protein
MESKGRYIGIFILIFLGSFAFVWFRGFGGGYERLVNEFAANNMQEDVSFSTTDAIDNLAELEDESGALIDAYRYYDVALSDNRELRLMGACEKVDIPAVLTGRELANPGEILLAPNFYNAYGYELGDTIEVSGRTFTVIGTAALPHYVYPLKYINDIMPATGFGLGVVLEEDMEAFPEAVTVYAARFTDRNNISTQVTKLYSLLSEKEHNLSEWMDAATNKRIRMAWATISGMKAMSIPLPVAMFLLCCLIVGLMIWRMVRADGVIIGGLYAQGYRHRELLRHYMAIPILLAATAGLAGVLISLPTIAPTIKAMALEYYVVPCENVPISLADVALGVLMPVAFLGLACWAVIRRELKKTPAELMKGDEKKAKVNALERSLNLERFRFDRKFQLREQVRSIPRLLFLLFGVMAASFLMLLGFTLNNSYSAVLSGGSDESYNYAWEYAFKEIKQGEPPAGAVPFNAIRCYPEGRESAEFYLNGITTDAPHVYELLDAYGNELPKDQVNITSLLADRLKVRVGDTVTAINKLDGKAYTLTIDGIVQTYAGQFIYMPLEEINLMLGMIPDSYSGVFSNETLDLDPGELSGVKDLKNMTSAMDDLMLPLMMVVVGTTVIAGVMGAIIIFLVTSLMIEESRGYISLLKVFGYRGKEVKKLTLGGGVPIVIIGFLLGIPLMLISANALYSYLGEMINLALPMILSPLYIALSFVLIYAVYELTKLICGKKLEKIPMSEALKAGAE